jgi:hypothetical protein
MTREFVRSDWDFFVIFLSLALWLIFALVRGSPKTEPAYVNAGHLNPICWLAETIPSIIRTELAVRARLLCSSGGGGGVVCSHRHLCFPSVRTRSLAPQLRSITRVNPLASLPRSTTTLPRLLGMSPPQGKASAREEKEWNKLADAMEYYHSHFRHSFESIYDVREHAGARP